MTRDLDAVTSLPEPDWDDFVFRGARFGIQPRTSDCLKFVRKSRVFLLHHVPTKVPIDVSVAGSPFELHSLEHRIFRKRYGLRVPLPRVEDLIIFKAVARRPIDDADIATLVQKHPSFDEKYVRRWLVEFSESIEDPTMAIDFDQLLKRIRRSSPSG